MTDRIYTAENVLDLVRRVYDITILSNKDKTDWVAQATFPTPDGMMTMANGGKGDDHYDGLYFLLYKMAEVKRDGKIPDNIMKLAPGEGAPLDVAIDLLEEKKNHEV